MFGKRRRGEEQEEAERRALFAELAKRPDTICPFLGMAESRTEYTDGVSPQHRCYAFGDPAELSDEQQTKVCLQRGYGNCPRYLRGVLVIPTEELEALRHPQAAQMPAVAEAGGGGRRRGGIIAAVLVLLLAGGGGAAAFLAFGNNGVAVTPTATPTTPATASLAPTATPSAPASVAPSSTTQLTPSPTPNVVPTTDPSASPLPTPGPDDTFGNYAVVVFDGTYPVYRLDADGNVSGTDRAVFGERSSAPVDLVEGADGTRYWRTLEGLYAGLAYVAGYSGDFEIYEIWVSPSGELRYRQLSGNEL